MKRLYSTTAPLLLVFLIAFATNVQAQFWKGIKGNGNVTTEMRSLSFFDELSASSGIDVIYNKGEQSVKVIADENLIDLIITEVKGGKLIIKRKNNTNIKWSKKMEVHVTAQNLHDISISSGADFVAKDELNSKNFTLTTSSGADAKLTVDADVVSITTSSGGDADVVVTANEANITASSGADISVKGSANEATLNTSSGADIDGFSFVVKNCKASASSAGDISVTVSNSLVASASSGGDVTYKGNPSSVDQSSSSGGDVSKQ